MIEESKEEKSNSEIIKLNPTNQYNLSLEQALLSYQYKPRSGIETLDDIWEKADEGCYHSIIDLEKDIEFVVLKAINARCLNPLSKIYLTNVLSKSILFLKSKKDEYK